MSFTIPVYLFVFCLLLAYLEVQIEGKEGWAKKIPTWRPSSREWWVKLYRSIMDQRELTGYHLGIFALVVFVLHTPFWFGTHWSFTRECLVLSEFFLVAIVWDFLWFVINPSFGWKKFRPAHVAWHKSWLGPWPVSYYWGLVFSLVFGLCTYGLIAGFWYWIQQFLILILLVSVTILLRFVFDKRS